MDSKINLVRKIMRDVYEANSDVHGIVLTEAEFEKEFSVIAKELTVADLFLSDSEFEALVSKTAEKREPLMLCKINAMRIKSSAGDSYAVLVDSGRDENRVPNISVFDNAEDAISFAETEWRRLNADNKEPLKITALTQCR